MRRIEPSSLRREVSLLSVLKVGYEAQRGVLPPCVKAGYEAQRGVSLPVKSWV